MIEDETHSSRAAGFYKLPVADRVTRIVNFADLSSEDEAVLTAHQSLSVSRADKMVENAAAVFGLPQGFAANFRVDDKDYFMPMVIEEPSVIAAASHAAKLLRDGGGIRTEATAPVMIGQLQICDLENPREAAAQLESLAEELVEAANQAQPRLVQRGGGARSIEVRVLEETPVGPMLVVHLHVDVRDAMGANMVNTMMETLAPLCKNWVGGDICLKILSNLADRRLVTAVGRVPLERLGRKNPAMPGALVAERVVKASAFAEVDPYRAATHNKGTMNGVDAFLIATGQDWRAVEAGAHAYAAQSGRYTALSKWRVVDGFLEGTLTLPMQVGTVGGVIRVHPLVQVNHRVLGVNNASTLGRLAASVGLAQNLAAILALATEGIQRGHMSLHARNVAAAAGANDDEIEAIAKEMVRTNTINLESAAALIEEQ